MESREAEKKRKRSGAVMASVFFSIFIIGLIILLVNIFNEKTTYISDGEGITKGPYLYCTTRINAQNTFFDLSDAKSAQQTIKIVFQNKRIDDITYNATIVYADNEIAKTKSAKFYADYASYMQNNSAKMTDFSPNFSVANDTDVKINLYATAEQLNPVLARVFSIDDPDINLNNYTSKEFSNFYANKGFNCKITE